MRLSSARGLAFLAGVAFAAVSFAGLKAEELAAPAVHPAGEATGKPPQVVEADTIFDQYRFRSGEVIDKLRLHYATLGVPHRDKHGVIDNAILMLHWTNASGRALLSPNYMKALFAPGRPLDADRYFLIFPDNVGHGRSSKPSDGLKGKFPNYGYNDMVDLQHRLVTETLGVVHLRAIVGVSMGGMNAWQWAEAYPEFVDGIMPVVALPTKVSGRNLLWRRIVIDGIRSDPGWNGGNYTAQPARLAQVYPVLRMMIDGVRHLQQQVPDGAAADKVLATLKQESDKIDANDILYSLKSSADYDPEPGIASIKAKVLALDFDDDEFNPVSLGIFKQLVGRGRGAWAIIQPGTDKSFGHLTMAHPELWANHVAEFMRKLGEAARGGSRPRGEVR